jgi:hypothetical protein
MDDYKDESDNKWLDPIANHFGKPKSNFPFFRAVIFALCFLFGLIWVRILITWLFNNPK